MPFHVHLQRWLRTEDAFNLTEQEVRERFVDSWRRGEPIIIRGRTWVPHLATIRIVEGPAITSSQRSFGQGWMKAHEFGEIVTDRFLHPAAHDDRADDDRISEEPKVERDDDISLTPARGAIHALFFGSSTRISVTATAIAGVIGIAVTIFIAANGSSGVRGVTSGKGASPAPAAPTSIASADDLRKYILSRPIWQTTPTTFSDSLEMAFNDQAVELGYPRVEVNGGDPIADSISQLVSDGAHLEGEPIFVIGRVVSSVESPVNTYGWTSGSAFDTVLMGPSGRGSVYALTTAGDNVGEVVFFPAVVAAVGSLTGGSPASYVISLGDPMPTASLGAAGTDTIRGLARRFGRRALPP